MVPSKKVAFVEYEDETKAGNAMTALVGVKIGDYSMQVTYAKRWELLSKNQTQQITKKKKNLFNFIINLVFTRKIKWQ